jgi:hypothetical protein
MTTLFDVPAGQATQARGIDFLESIPGLLKRLQIRALVFILQTYVCENPRRVFILV